MNEPWIGRHARALVTGGSGFIGTNLMQHYLERGVTVVNVDTLSPRDASQARYWRPGSVLHGESLAECVRDFAPTHVFHLAARTDMRGRVLSDYDTNVAGTKNVLAALREAESVQHFVLASSRLVCKIGYQPRSDEDYRPTTPYGESKVAAEQLVRNAGLAVPWTIARPTSIWGPWFGIPYRTFFDAVRSGRYADPGRHRVEKSFGFVGNTVFQLDALAASRELAEKTVYVADDEPIELWTFANHIKKAFGGDGPICTAPLPILRIAARAGDLIERFGFEAPLTSFRLENMLTPMVMDTAPLNRLTGDLPYSELGLR